MRKRLGRLYRARLPLLETACSQLEVATREALAALPHVDRIAFRVKSVDSFVKKAIDPENKPPYAAPLREIEDQMAGRIIAFFRMDLSPVRELLQRTFTEVEWSRRRPLRDAEFGYESDHMICILPPHLKPAGWNDRDDLPTTFELQLRTLFMHAYAEPQHDLAYKAPSDLPSEVRREIGWIAASAWGADHAYERIMAWQATRRSATPQPIRRAKKVPRDAIPRDSRRRLSGR